MRGVWLGVVVVAVGCTRLNSAFEQDTDAVGGSAGNGPSTTSKTGDPTSTSAGDGTSGVFTSTTNPTASSSSPTQGLTATTDSSTSGVADSAPGITSSTSSDPPPPPDPTDPILVVYAAEGWTGSAALAGTSASFLADTHCLQDPEFSDGDLPCDLSSTLRGFIRPEGAAIDGFLDGTPGAWTMLPLYGAHSLGVAPLAPDIESLVIDGPELSLSNGGVISDVPRNGFWSGGVDVTMPDCEEWSALSAGSSGTYGRFDSTSNTWFHAGESGCMDTKPILCICDATFGDLTP